MAGQVERQARSSRRGSYEGRLTWRHRQTEATYATADGRQSLGFRHGQRADQSVPRAPRRPRMLWRGRVTIALGASAIALLCAQLLPSSPEAGGGCRPRPPALRRRPRPLPNPSARPIRWLPKRCPRSPGSLRRLRPRSGPRPRRRWATSPLRACAAHRMRGELARVSSRLSENLALPGAEPLQIEYTLDPELTDEVYSILRRGRCLARPRGRARRAHRRRARLRGHGRAPPARRARVSGGVAGQGGDGGRGDRTRPGRAAPVASSAVPTG